MILGLVVRKKKKTVPFVSLAQASVIWREVTPVKELPLSDWWMAKSVGYFLPWWLILFFTDGWYRRAYPTVCNAIPRHVVLECRKQTEWAMRSKPVRSTPQGFWFSACLRALAWVPTLISLNDGLWSVSISQINPFLPKLVLLACSSPAANSNLIHLAAFMAGSS